MGDAAGVASKVIDKVAPVAEVVDPRTKVVASLAKKGLDVFKNAVASKETKKEKKEEKPKEEPEPKKLLSVQ